MKLRFGALWRNFSRLINLVVLLVALVLAVFVFRDEGGSLSGSGRVSDGDSLRIGSQRIRLLGIDAPELDQTCRNAAGQDWPCGRSSKSRLAGIIRGKTIVCVSEARDRYGRLLARCTVDGADIAAQMVREGMAVSYGDSGNEQAFARAAKKGIWVGPFTMPRAWRDGQREPDAQSGLWHWITGWFGGG